MGKRERVPAQTFTVSNTHHPQSYLRLSDATLQHLNEQTHRKMQQQAEALYAQEHEFKTKFADLTVVELEKWISNFDEGMLCSKSHHLLMMQGPDSDDDFSDVEKKTKCDCGGFYYPHMKEKHLFTNDRHLLFIAEKFRGNLCAYCTHVLNLHWNRFGTTI